MRCSGMAGARPGSSFASVAIGRPMPIPPLASAVIPAPGTPSQPVSGAELLRCLDTPEVRALR